MFYKKIKAQFNKIELILQKMLIIVFSLVCGFLLAKSAFKNVFSPFSLSFLAIAPSTKLSVTSLYAGSFFGYLTNDFSVLNFKYICANTIIYIVIMLFGKKNYLKNLYTPIFPGAVCFCAGVLFLFADTFGIYDFLLVICESTLCSCAAFFIKYILDSIKKHIKLDVKDIISFNITLLIVICTLDNFYIYGFSVSVIFLQTIVFLSAYYLEMKISSVFSLSLCVVMSLLHYTNTQYFIYFYLPALLCSIISSVNKKYIVPTYTAAQTMLISIGGFSIYNLSFLISPLVSGIVFFLIPKEKLENILSVYIDIKDKKIELEANNEICINYCKSADNLIDKVFNNECISLLDNEKHNRIKRLLSKEKCKNIDVSNYFNLSGKQIISVVCECERNLSTQKVADILGKVFDSEFKLCENKNEENIFRSKFVVKENYKIECYALFKAKENEKVCGDNVSAFKSTDSMYNIVLADGMGSGKEAYSKSYDTINILKKLISSGVDAVTAIKTVNSSLGILKERMGFSTIDLCSVSLRTGVADFYKCGAYLTIIKRDDYLITIKENGLPAGLGDQMQIDKQTIKLQNNDIVIMLSDGVSNVIENLQLQILQCDFFNIESAARNLIDWCYRNTHKKYDDDMTVIVIKILNK